jgi:hypothetical protein
VAADSSNDVWAVGQGNGVGQVEHWNGQTWNIVPSPSRVINLRAVTALSPTDVWAAGVTGATHIPSAVIEHWDGSSWSVVASPNPTTNGNSFLDGIAAASANDIWAVGGASGFPSVPITEHWDGTSWSIVATPSGVSSLNGVTALSDGTVVAVGQGTNGSAVILHS